VTALPIRPDSLPWRSADDLSSFPVHHEPQPDGQRIARPLPEHRPRHLPAALARPASPHPASSRAAEGRLARQVACAAGAFEHGLLGRAPASVTVVATDSWMVVHVHEPFSAMEQQLAASGEEGASRVRAVHREIFEQTADALLEHVRRCTGVEFRGALAHVDIATRSVTKTLTTSLAVDLFLMGEGLPSLGVPVNAHLQANGTPGASATQAPGMSEQSGMPEKSGKLGMPATTGNGAGRR
jgi:uncharacterized protein YbcI